MKVLYFDPITGLSGDMMLAALIDLGVSRDNLKKALNFIPGAEMKVGRVNRQGVSARTVRFVTRSKIREKQFIPLIRKSKLPARIKSQAIEIVDKIFAVEKKVHHTKHLHLHEMADADTLLDIVGVLAAIESLNVEKIFSKPITAGSGFIKTIEGNMPAFNFATAELLKNFPVRFLPIAAELTTPTGAAIISSIATGSDDLSISKLLRVGLGAGSMDIEGYPNLLRVFLAESHQHLTDECTVIQTNIDDMNPQDYEMLFDKLYANGALDVSLSPTIMKRSRPGILLTVLCQANINNIVDTLFAYTTSIGFRVSNTRRIKFRRQIVKVKSPYGTVGVKMIEYGGKKRYSLEYRDLLRIAEKRKQSTNEVRNELMRLLNDKLIKHER
ncbi:MAG: nickel pincer cofactor biosynthesis protein LarC [candidate division WOR-3 bacterium]|nr:MAG: nickel pincer cofactor biosynthesis protein LarC [candidate division WOR-3 bacterium]